MPIHFDRVFCGSLAFKAETFFQVIEDLKAQLLRPLQLHAPLEDVGFEYGFNSYYLENVVKYWRDEYLVNWPKRESLLKKFPHFQTEIQG